MLHTDSQQRIRITQAGFENYNGQMGILFFENGLSTNPVPFKDANRLSATLLCEFEDGTSCNPAQRLLDTAGQEAPQARETFDEQPGAATAAPAARVTPVVELQDQPAAQYTVVQLEEIADSKGIQGLRDIATPLGIKSNSITGLIAELIKAGVAQKGE